MFEYHPYYEVDDQQDHPDTTSHAVAHDEDMGHAVGKLSTVTNQIRGTDGKTYNIPINAAHLHSLITFMKKVLDGDALPYKVRSRGRVDVRSMAYDIKMLAAYARLHDPSLSYSPDLEFFFEQYCKHEISQYSHVDWIGGDFGEDDRRDVGPRFAEMANEFVLMLREEARRAKLRKRICDWKSRGKNNLDYLVTYLNYLFERFARLMVVDMVFEYRKTACANIEEAIDRREAMQGRADREYEAYMNGVVHHEENPRWVSLAELKEDWHHLKQNMKGKRSIFKHLVGYVGRIEYSRDAGHHLHICFVFNGAQVQDDVGYSLKIAQYWKEEITEGRGYAFSCNVKAAQGGYRNVGVGLIDHYDSVKRKHLWTAVSYFAKATQLVRIKHSGKQKMFLHGKMKTLTGPKRGRPRTKGIEPVPFESPAFPKI
ncbi:inovirus-type Gp2 protein [Burkholderia pseudomallei]|uniref:inovirus-type Gp2 protein n=1 Tax=Burkholderia pseudomallei TaxID=28450 RepID=UPI000E69DF8A|nr:inovirus-type Gp2 protein [Burkholderia pseudomallei]RIV48792.1 inovirus Gp2 family protein [Burkholderia pseudomallei]RIV63824.1 inovirus Gp2 family protein [Burkholderia pseudomallei]